VEFLGTSEADLLKVAVHLRSGNLVVWHSLRYYGLSASGYDRFAVERLYRAKRRDAGEALAVHALDVDDARRYGHLNDLAGRLADAFWPGYLSLVVEKTGEVADFVTSGMPSVLLSCAEGLAYSLPATARTMIVSSSANISGMPPATTMAEVREFIANAGAPIGAVVGDGPCPVNAPTTIVSTITEPPTILREGAVPSDAIRRIAPEVVVRERVKKPPARTGAAPALPGTA